jgi:hypothetical protein
VLCNDRDYDWECKSDYRGQWKVLNCGFKLQSAVKNTNDILEILELFSVMNLERYSN